MRIPPSILILIMVCALAPACDWRTAEQPARDGAERTIPDTAQATLSTFALQPLGSVDSTTIGMLEEAIAARYTAHVIVRSALPLPAEAFYKPRGRYRADSLLGYLERNLDRDDTRLIGITEKDISTTKGTHRDWGVLGLGVLGGRPCVISTYRMGKGRVPQALFAHRLASVAVHELGHTFGLPHCPSKGCLMQDAEGSVATIDGEEEFCAACSGRLQAKGVLR